MRGQSNKYNNELCDNEMTFQDCELAILRHRVDESEEISSNKKVNTPEINRMISIVEKFLIRKKCICYGGTAINNILPKNAQFYNRDVEIPDYDFYSPTALEDAKELADIYYKEGYEDVEAKSGTHYGTFKVFVNFIPMADITLLPLELFQNISKDAITFAGIKYAPVNFLRMNMFLELSRPAGDVSRWEKVFKRLTLLNTHYPFKTENAPCNSITFQRKMDDVDYDSEKIYTVTRDTFIDLDVVFFGGYANSLYSKYMPKSRRRIVEKIPDFDVLSKEYEKTATILSERLTVAGFANIELVKHGAIGEIVPENIEMRIGQETIAFIYKPFGCVSYNKIQVNNHTLNVATIDTMLTYYLAFYYVDKPYYDRDRILCMSKFLFDVQQENRLAQGGLLRRFSMDCYGTQETLDDIRAKKSEKFKKLRKKRDTLEYEMWFLKYNPANNSTSIKSTNNITKPYMSSIQPNIKDIVGSKIKVYSKTVLNRDHKKKTIKTISSPSPLSIPAVYNYLGKTVKKRKYKKTGKNNRQTRRDRGYLY